MTDLMDTAWTRASLQAAAAALAPRRPGPRQRRLDRRARAAAHVQVPVPAGQQAHDPLLRPAPSSRLRAALLALLAAAAVAAHAGLLALATLGSGLLGTPAARPARERVRIEARQAESRPAPPPPAAAPVRKPAPPPRPKPSPAVAAVPRALPEAPKAAAPVQEPPRPVVGLSLESTVEGGDGPAFAVGNTRLGETASVAEEPAAVPPPPPPPAPANRRATRAPQAGVRFTPPARSHAVAPDYPPALKAQGIEGDVVLRVDLDERGAVLAVAVLKGSGHPELDEAARRAAASEQYAPARRDGAAVPDVLTFTVRFRLTDG